VVAREVADWFRRIPLLISESGVRRPREGGVEETKWDVDGCDEGPMRPSDEGVRPDRT
jgi:hypothetical protein